MDERQYAEITKAFGKITKTLRLILIVLCAILGALWFRLR
jgi:hypothetical protein